MAIASSTTASVHACMAVNNAVLPNAIRRILQVHAYAAEDGSALILTARCRGTQVAIAAGTMRGNRPRAGHGRCTLADAGCQQLQQ